MSYKNPNYNTASNSNFSQLQSQVDDVKGVMTNNIDKILARGDKLDDLVDKTAELETTAIQFNVQAKKVRRKMWWKNTKMMLILGAVILIIIAIIVTVIALKFGGGGGSGGATTKPTPLTTTTTTTTPPSIKLAQNIIDVLTN